MQNQELVKQFVSANHVSIFDHDVNKIDLHKKKILSSKKSPVRRISVSIKVKNKPSSSEKTQDIPQEMA